MLFTLKNCFICSAITVLFHSVLANVLESEQSSFFGFTHEVTISDSTLEVVEQLEDEVFEQSRGDRRVRRYFDAYETPFLGPGRRKNYDSNYD